MLSVRDIMTGWVATSDPQRSLREAAITMANARTGSLIIVSKGKPVGIVTEKGVARALSEGANPDKVQVKKVMSKRLITASPDKRVEEAAEPMAEKQIKKLPVVEKGGLIGMVTQTDIVA
ncbi:MAG TPA: CBS domain-containing protein [Nitrososphaerales archaeon]|nr:CBS domain-containing protein [Nitrososphaerales archaeon]